MIEISKDIYFQDEIQLNQTKKEWAFVGSGAYGTCYLTQNNEVYKIYNFDISTIDQKPADFDGFIGLYNDTYIFPEGLIYVNNQLYGYIMRFIKGQELTFCYDDLTFKSLPKLIHKLEVDTAHISNQFIKNTDIKLQNTLVNSNGIFIIDTEEYRYNKAINPHKLYHSNMMRIKLMFINELSNRYPLIKGMARRDDIMQDILKSLKNDDTVSLAEFFKRLKIIAAHTLGEAVHTIGDLDKLDQRVKVKY